MVENFVIYAEGIFCASVCSLLPQPEVEKRMAAIECGTTHGWMLADKPFQNGLSNPGPCDKYPETHKHYLFEC